MHKTQKEFFFLIVLVLLFIPELFFDSIFFSNYKSFGYELTSFLVISFTFYLYFIASARLKLFLILMIPLSWLGEVICSDVLGLYHYRMEAVPIYVPFGHANIYALTWMLCQNKVVFDKFKSIKKYAIPFLISILILNDRLSLILRVPFFYLLRRKNYSSFYLIMSLIVLYVELIGTSFEI